MFVRVSAFPAIDLRVSICLSESLSFFIIRCLSNLADCAPTNSVDLLYHFYRRSKSFLLRSWKLNEIWRIAEKYTPIKMRHETYPNLGLLKQYYGYSWFNMRFWWGFKGMVVVLWCCLDKVGVDTNLNKEAARNQGAAWPTSFDSCSVGSTKSRNHTIYNF